MTYHPYPQQYSSQHTQQSPPPPPPPRRMPVWVMVAAGLAAIVMIGIIAGMTVVIAGRHGTGTPAAPAADQTSAATILVVGTLDLNSTPNDGNGSQCQGTGGYDDIANGAQVVIYDATGKSIGVTELASATSIDTLPDFGTCEFSFAARVPAGVGPYSVEVTHRGKVAFTQAGAGSVTLTLGG